MYTEFFGLAEKPFSITPDPRYLYMSARHTDALAHLVYGIAESGGFIQLTGEVGTGKTTLIRSLLEQLPEKTDIALILNPQLTTREFLQVICEELHTPPPSDDTVKARIDSLNAHLLKAHAAGRRVVLIVDEAQTLGAELLEQVRLLTNLETARQKLLQIILIGQPELRELLARPEMRQVAQRITGRYHLEPLGRDDVATYVQHRLRVAGLMADVFRPGALRRLYRRSRGIPRLINIVADRALLAAYSENHRNIDARLVDRAAAEVFGERRPGGRWWPSVAIVGGLAVFALATTNLWSPRPESPPVAQATATEASVTGALRGEPRATPGAATTDIAARVATAVADNPSPAPNAGNTDASTTADLPAAAATALTAPIAEPTADTAAAHVASPPTATGGPVVEPLTVASLASHADIAGDADAAVGELLTRWSASYDPNGAPPCVQAERQGLRCLTQSRGSLGELRELDLPVALALVDAERNTHYVAVTALGGEHAEVAAGGRRYALPLGEIGYHWYGEHVLLWRPPMTAVALKPGMTDTGVLWLRAVLAVLSGEPPPVEPSSVYDAELEARVRDYQRKHQLEVDGVVGARTQIELLGELGLSDGPQLSARN